VRLYLSSIRMGDHPEYLTALVGDDSRRAVVIANAMDDAPDDIRQAGLERERTALGDLGFDAAELDLRDYFDDERRLRSELAGVALAWLRGGNVSMLRYALRRSGGDTVFRRLLADDALVYAGYSAGPCVLSPSLRGLETVDDAEAVTRIYESEPVWDGPAHHAAGRSGAHHRRRERSDCVSALSCGSRSEPAGNIESCPSHVGRVVRQQPEHSGGDVGGIAHPRQRYLGNGPVQMLLGLTQA
jgi:dipeptidase E